MCLWRQACSVRVERDGMRRGRGVEARAGKVREGWSGEVEVGGLK